MLDVFRQRTYELERIDTGDYTPCEYETFLREIRFINRHLGDSTALRRTLLREITDAGLDEFSVLDVGAGSGELLRQIAEFAKESGRNVALTGLDLNEISTDVMSRGSVASGALHVVRGDALRLPFVDGAFDYAISSLFFHHLVENDIVAALKEMSRVARRGIFVIDLYRHPAAFVLYKLFCAAFRISPLVTHDGSLSIRRGFKPDELMDLAKEAGIKDPAIVSSSRFRLVLKSPHEAP